MVIYIKQHLSNIWSSVHEKLSNTATELKNSVAHKRKRVMNDLITNSVDPMSERNHTEIFALYPDFDIEQSSGKLYELLQTEFNSATPFTIFQSEI